MSLLRLSVAEKFAPLLQPARYKGAHGGRGSGKSHFFAEMLVATCLKRPTRAVCVREVQKSLDQSVKLLIEDKIRSLGVSESFRILNTHIETPWGGRIIFQGMQNHTADSIKSLEAYNVAWAEEAMRRLTPRGCMLLYTGSAIVDGGDPFRERLDALAREHDCSLEYEEIDPDIFGDELTRDAYAGVERLAAVGAVIRRAG